MHRPLIMPVTNTWFYGSGGCSASTDMIRHRQVASSIDSSPVAVRAALTTQQIISGCSATYSRSVTQKKATKLHYSVAFSMQHC
jgi:hypothetical protein